MKKILLTEIPITFSNLTWRIFSPLTTMLIFGYVLGKIFHTQRFFIILAIIASVIITIWGFYTTTKQTISSQEN